MNPNNFSPLKWKENRLKHYSSAKLLKVNKISEEEEHNETQMLGNGKAHLEKRISLCTTYTQGIADGQNQLIERSETNPFLKYKLKIKMEKHQKILKGYEDKPREKDPMPEGSIATLKQLRKEQKKDALQSYKKIRENLKRKKLDESPSI